MRVKWLIISGLFAVGLLLLPFSYVSYDQSNTQKQTGLGIELELMAAVQNTAAATGVSSVFWPAFLEQLQAVWSVAAQTIDAIGGVPDDLFDVVANDPPESAADLADTTTTINAATQFGDAPAPQLYDGTLIFNVPLVANDTLQVTGPTELSDLLVTGEFSINNLDVPGVGSFGSVVSGGGQFGSLSVSGNTQLNTLSVSGPVNFANVTAGNLTVSNSLLALSGMTTGGADVDLEGGNIYAANIINEIIAGDNIDITGTPNGPVISADVPSLGSRVRSLNGSTGALTLSGGTDILISGLSITNSSTLDSVRGRGGCVDCILDADVVNALTILGGAIDDTVIGATTAATGTFTNLTVTGGATSTYAGSINVTGTGCVAVNGVCLGGGVSALNDLSDVTITGVVSGELLSYNGTQWVNASTGSLGIGDGTYLGLTDTPSSYLVGALPYVNGAGNALTQSTNLVFDGTQLALGSTTPVTTLTVNGDVSLVGRQLVRWYETDNTNYVAFRASSSLASDIVWTLPDADGASNEVLTTDGSGNLRFVDVTTLGGVSALNDLSDVTLSATTLGDVLVYNGTVWVDQATSTLGLGDGTFIGLSDTYGSYSAGAIVYANAAADALTQSTNFTFDGTSLLLGTSTALTAFTIDGEISVVDGQGVRFYDADSTQYVALQASSTIGSSFTLTLPTDNGTANQVLVTDGSGLLRFDDVSAIGGGATTFLALTDTPGTYTDESIPYVTGSSSLTFSPNFGFDGTNLYIGATAASDRLTVHGSTYFGANASTPGLVYDNSGDRVGVGTANPSEKFTVEGGSVLQRGAANGGTYTPTQIGSVGLADSATDSFIVGSLAYVVSNSSGDDLHIIDITDRTSPVELGSVDLSANVNDVHVSGQYAYAVTDVTGPDFHIIDVSDPAAPVQVGSLNLDTSARGVAVQGRYAYVVTADTGDDFHVIDISDPTAPVQVGAASLPTNGNELAISGNYAYVVTDVTTDGFYVFDISDETAPSIVGSTTLPAVGNDVEVRGRYAYVATASTGDDLHIVDISSSSTPAIVGSLNLATGANDLAVAGSYVYVTTVGTGDDIHVVDITDPTTPVETGSEEVTAGTALSVSVAGRYAYITTSSVGDDFLVFDLTGVEAQTVLAHSLESGTLSVLGDMVAGGSLYLAEGLRAGMAGLQTDGSLMAFGTKDSFVGGNFGLGTTTPAYTLDVYGDARIDGNLYDTTGSAGTAGYVLQSTASGITWVATSSLGIAGGSGGGSGGGGLQSIQVFDTAGTSTWTKPAGIDAVRVIVTGGGGGGGGADDNGSGNGSAGGGGGAGATAIEFIDVSATSSVFINIGSGGSGGSTSGGNGSAGGSTAFSTYTVAGGGSGGEGGDDSNGTGGAGGTVTISGDVNVLGSDGATASTDNFSGDGGGSYWGSSDGYSVYLDNSGITASVYGSGGGGAVEDDPAGRSGGAGAPGIIVVYEYQTQGLATGTIETGTQGQLAFYENGGNTLTATSSLFLDTNGYFGIGTTSPFSRLTVAGDITPDANLTYDLGSSTRRWSNLWAETLNVGTSTWSIFNANDGRLAVSNAAEQGGTEMFSILPNGNVGIGTTSPYAKLSIAGNIVASSFVSTSTATSTFSTLQVTGGLYDTNGTAGTSGYVLQSTGSGVQWVATSSLNIAGSGGSGGSQYLTNHTFTSTSTWTALSGLTATQTIPVWIDTTDLTTGAAYVVVDGVTVEVVTPGNASTRVVAPTSSLAIQTVDYSFDVTTASFVDGFSIGGQESQPQSVTFSTDGTKMFVLGYSGDDVNEYTLSTAFDVSTASFVDSFSIGAQESIPYSVTFNPDGTKMFVVGVNGDDVNEYTLSTGFDVSTASFVDSFSVSGQATFPYIVAFSNDGTKMFIFDSNSGAVYQYTLTTGFDVSTASYASVSQSISGLQGMTFNPDGSSLFTINTSGDITEYVLGMPFDITTISVARSTNVGNSRDIAFNANGTKMFVLDTSNNVDEYTLDGDYSGTVYASIGEVGGGGDSLLTDAGTNVHLTTVTDNFSIGTTSDNGVLTVAKNTTDTLLSLSQYGTGDLLNLFDGTTEVFSILDGGNVGIGTTSPAFALTVSGTIAPALNLAYDLGSSSNRFANLWAETLNVGTSTWSIFNGTNGRLAFSNAAEQAGTEILTLAPGGNVGIGTTSPAYALDVYGDARIDGSLYDAFGSAGSPGQVLQSTASGLQWVSTSSLNISSGGGGGGSSASAVGLIGAFATSSCPAGWLVADGSSVATSTYSALYDQIGYSYGGSGASFSLPDYRGEFLRGWDNGAGNDPDAGSRTDRGDGTTGDNVGTKQEDEFESHTHTVSTVPGSGDGSSHNSDSGPRTAAGTTGATGGNETRPRNVNVLYCISYEESINGTGADLAEYYETDGTPAPGHIVALSNDTFTYSDPNLGNTTLPVLTKATSTTPLLGVVSTQPGVTLGAEIVAHATFPRPIALSGRVPVKVNLEGGPIFPGDRIAPSSAPGIGRKANLFESTIGTAITEFAAESDTDSGEVVVFIDPQEGFSTDYLTDVLFTNTATATTSASSTFTLLTEFIPISPTDTIWSRLYSLAVNFVDGVLAVVGLSADTVETNQLCIGATCVDEDTLKALLIDQATGVAEQSETADQSESESVSEANQTEGTQTDEQTESEAEGDSGGGSTESSTDPVPSETETGTSTSTTSDTGASEQTETETVNATTTIETNTEANSTEVSTSTESVPNEDEDGGAEEEVILEQSASEESESTAETEEVSEASYPSPEDEVLNEPESEAEVDVDTVSSPEVDEGEAA